MGLALIGPLALGIGISTTLWAAAGVIALCQTAVFLVPSVRRLEADPALPRAAPPPRPIEPGD